MKKLLTIALIATFGFSAISCNDRNDEVLVQDNDTYSVMTDVTANFTAANSYTFSQGISIAQTDVVLVYRDINSNSNSSSVWQLLPKTEFLSGGRELDYNFLFDSQNVEVFTEANFDQSLLTSTEAGQYLNNQRFRIVLVPASATKNAPVNYEDYQSVLKYYNIPDRD